MISAFVMDELQLRRAHHFGYSKGGWVGCGMAEHAPDRLRSLILGGAHAPPREREAHSLLAPDDMAAMRAREVDDLGYENDLLTGKCRASLWPETLTHAIPRLRRHAAEIPNAKSVTAHGQNHAGTFFRSDLMVPHVMHFLREVA